jgi:hypothetical protein
MEKTCLHCGKRFFTHPAVVSQQYCSDADCQRARKRKWQKEKLVRDPDYRENQRASQKAWCERNKGYWRQYREKNPGYRDRNRLLQQTRNRKIAKMDELPQSPISPGRYRLVPLDGSIAKMDELIVELGIITREVASG